MSKNTLAAVLHGIKDLRVEERAIPELEAGQALVRVRRGGICGSDVHYFEEGRFGSFAMTAPFILGHEVAGEVAAVAQGVTKPAVGQRVVVNPARQCGHCDYCRAGRGNLCRYVRMLGSASTRPPTHGGFSQYLAIGAEQCFPVSAAIDDGLCAMMEPFAVALHALKRAGSVVGKSVLVTGGGPIGLLTVIAARACGATTIAVSDPVADRRQMALQVGADAALNPAEGSFQDQVTALTGDGFEFLFEASGAVPALRQALEVVRRGGTMVQIGVYSAPEFPLPVNQLLVRELQFVGSFRYGNVWEEAIRLATSGRVNLRPLISRVFPLRQAGEALELACAKTGIVKVQIDLT
jgi:L-idonate 5-dehydrogenase